MGQSAMIDPNQIHEFQSEIYTLQIDKLNIKVQADLRKIEEIWQQRIEEMRSSLTETYNFLKGTAYLWDRHFQRIENAQILVLHDLSNTIEKDNRSINVKEIFFMYIILIDI